MKREINQQVTREKIIQLRKTHGYSQDDVAQLIEGSRTYYCSMENGNRELNELFLQRLADIYDIEFEEICVFVESEYDKLEKTMSILDSYRPTNYYMVRHGNLAEDIIDLIKYFEESKISEYKLLDPMLNNLGFEVKLINIHDYIEKWNIESENNNSRIIINKSRKLLEYFKSNNNYEACVLISNRHEPSQRFLINIDKYLELENFIYLSLVGNLENVFEEYNQFYKSFSPHALSGLDDIINAGTNYNNSMDDSVPNYIETEKDNDLDDIISDSMKEEDNDAFFDKLIGYKQAKLHLLKINEYIGKLLDMEDEIKQKNKKEKDKI